MVPVSGLDNTASTSLGVQVMPNPFSNELRFAFSNPTLIPTTLEITDAFGRLVFRTENIRAESYTYNRSDLAAGVYFWRLSNAANAASGKVTAE